MGQTTCKACPENTESVPPAISLQDCRCKKGYYSPVYDESQTYGLPGFACLSCSTQDFAMSLGTSGRCHFHLSEFTQHTQLEYKC